MAPPVFSWQEMAQAPDFPRDPVARATLRKKYLTDFGPQLLDTAAAAAGLHPTLLQSVKQVESGKGWDPNVRSPAGAVGPMQLMGPAAQDVQVDRFDPEQNIRGGAQYLRKMIDAFDGDVSKGLAAYNSGESRVRTAIAIGGENWIARLPGETRTYLRRVAQARTAGMPIEAVAPVSEYPLPLQPTVTGVPREGPLALQMRIGKEEPPPSAAPFTLEELTSSEEYRALKPPAREATRLKYLRDFPAPPPFAGAPRLGMGGAGGSWEETPPPLPSGAKWGGAGGSWEETPPPLPSGATDLLPIPFEGFAPNSPTEVIRAFTRSRLGRALTAPEEPPRQPDVPEFMTMEEQRRRAMGFPEKPIYRPAESFMDWLVHGAGKVAQYALPHKFLPGIPKPGVSPSVESARLPEEAGVAKPMTPSFAGAPRLGMGGAGGSWEETPPPLPSGAKWGGAGGSWEETPPPLPSGATDLLPIPFEGFAPNSPTEVIRAFTRSRLGRALTAPEEPPRQPDVPEFMTMEEQRRRAMGFPEKPIYRPAESFMDWLVHGAGKVAQYALPHKFLPGIPKPGVSPSVESARLPEASALPAPPPYTGPPTTLQNLAEKVATGEIPLTPDVRADLMRWVETPSRQPAPLSLGPPRPEQALPPGRETEISPRRGTQPLDPPRPAQALPSGRETEPIVSQAEQALLPTRGTQELVGPPKPVQGEVPEPLPRVEEPPALLPEAVETSVLPEEAGVAKPMTPSGKELWEMNYEEISAALEKGREADKNLLVEIFGADGARKYRALERKANSTVVSPEVSNQASNEMEKMQESLTEAQQNRLFGIGETSPQVDELKEYQSALGALDFESPQDLGQSLRTALTRVGQESDPAKMTNDQRVAYAQLREAFQYAQEQGWDTDVVSQAAIRAASERFSVPEDAAFMLRRFVKQPLPPPSKPEPAIALPAPTPSTGALKAVQEEGQGEALATEVPSPVSSATPKAVPSPPSTKAAPRKTPKPALEARLKSIAAGEPGVSYTLNPHERKKLIAQLGLPQGVSNKEIAQAFVARAPDITPIEKPPVEKLPTGEEQYGLSSAFIKREMPKTKIKAKGAQKDIEETPLFGQERAKAVAAEEAKQGQMFQGPPQPTTLPKGKRLSQFIKEQGGLNLQGYFGGKDELADMTGGRRVLPGLLNNTKPVTKVHEVSLAAQEAGYPVTGGDEEARLDSFLAALRKDIQEEPIYPVDVQNARALAQAQNDELTQVLQLRERFPGKTLEEITTETLESSTLSDTEKREILSTVDMAGASESTETLFSEKQGVGPPAPTETTSVAAALPPSSPYPFESVARQIVASGGHTVTFDLNQRNAMYRAMGVSAEEKMSASGKTLADLDDVTFARGYLKWVKREKSRTRPETE